MYLLKCWFTYILGELASSHLTSLTTLKSKFDTLNLPIYTFSFISLSYIKKYIESLLLKNFFLMV